MSYSKLRNQIESQIDVKKPTEDYVNAYFKDEHVLRIKELSGRYIYHLYNDLAHLETQHDFNKFLDKLYRDADENAKECIQIAYLTKDIYGRKIKSWTDNALKAFDLLLIKLINGLLGEKIPKPKGKPYETDVYDYLILKSGSLYEIGIAFQSIYQSRNAFTHVQIEESEGIRIPKTWSNKKYNREKESILFQFNNALNHIETELVNHVF